MNILITKRADSEIEYHVRRMLKQGYFDNRDNVAAYFNTILEDAYAKIPFKKDRPAAPKYKCFKYGYPTHQTIYVVYAKKTSWSCLYKILDNEAVITFIHNNFHRIYNK